MALCKSNAPLPWLGPGHTKKAWWNFLSGVLRQAGQKRGVRSHQKNRPQFWWIYFCAEEYFYHGQIAAEFILSEAGLKRSAKNLASSADVMENEETSARRQDAEKKPLV